MRSESGVKELDRYGWSGAHSEKMTVNRAWRRCRSHTDSLARVSQGRDSKDKGSEASMCPVFLGTVCREQSEKVEVEARQSSHRKDLDLLLQGAGNLVYGSQVGRSPVA